MTKKALPFRKLFLPVLILVWFFMPNRIIAQQASILSATISEYNITPNGLLDVSIMNHIGDVQVVLEAKILNSQNEALISVVTKPFTLKKGLSIVSQLNVGITSVMYASNNQGNLLKNSHILSTGKYHYCASISGVDVSDQYCQDIEAENSTFLYLVSPPDKEELETKYPILIWTHSEQFSLTNQNEYYRIIVTELNKGQSAEAAINTNIPVYMKNYLNSHQVQYPFDAKELQTGKEYAWQVQKMYSGAIVNKTEAWQFKFKDKEVETKNYTLLKQALDGSTYYAVNEKIYFKFEEPYYSADSKLAAKIYNAERKEFNPQAKNELKKEGKETIKYTGLNLFQMDLSSLNLKSGIYTLEVTDEKGKLYLLQFMIK